MRGDCLEAKLQSLRAVIPAILITILFTPLGGQEQPKPADKPSANPAAHPQPQSPTFRATTRLVVVDVVATNGKGEPVTDLDAADFAVLENGKPQQVSSFNLQVPASPQVRDTEASIPELPQLQPGVFTNAPRYKKTSVWNVLLLDYMNSQVTSQADLRQQLVKVLDKLPEEPLAVYILTDKHGPRGATAGDPGVEEPYLATTG
jgi:hypothetical protein